MPRRLRPPILVALSLLVTTLAADPLIDAAKSSNRPALITLLKQKSDPNTPGPDGLTALHWAARNSDLESAQLLLRAGANPKPADRYGITPLSLAATNGDPRMIDLLLTSGADPNASLPEGETVLMTAARTGNPDAVRALLKRGANPNAKENTMGETALMWAAAENHADAIRTLIQGGADPNTRSTVLTLAPFKWVTSGMVSTMLPRGGWTALMHAARQNATDAARALAGSKADLNLTDPDGTSALVFAIINAHFDLAAMLLDRGANPNVADETGMAALYAAVDMHSLGPMISRPAPKLVDELDSVGLVKLLIKHGANVNARLKRPVIGRHHDGGDASLGEGATALMRAVKANDVQVITALLEAGANPHLTLKDYTNALMISAAGGARAGAYAAAFNVTESGTIEVMKLLLDKGIDIDAFNSNGLTALHRAAARGADQVVRFLAENGAKLDQRDRQNRTPIDMALEVQRVAGATPLKPKESTAALLRSFQSKQ